MDQTHPSDLAEFLGAFYRIVYTVFYLCFCLLMTLFLIFVVGLRPLELFYASVGPGFPVPTVVEVFELFAFLSLLFMKTATLIIDALTPQLD